MRSRNARTLDEGSVLYLTVGRTGVFVRDVATSTVTARVEQADLLAMNGAVQVIDAVLLPAAPDDLTGVPSTLGVPPT